jgi:beta-RFAP synthase
MNREVTITTGARLHFGLLSDGSMQGRRYGGAGLMIDSPGFRLVATQSDGDSYHGSHAAARRAESFVASYRANNPGGHLVPGCHIEIEDEIPEHRGFGSGTQLGMAVAQALAVLADDETSNPEVLARRVRRGARSALGIHGFGCGGFVVDVGKGADDAIGTLAARAEFPEEWRLLLVSPTGQAGLSGATERQAFDRLPQMPQTTTDALCGILLTRLLPAVVEADYAACGEALSRFGRLVGEYFAPVQGGIYVNREMAELSDYLRRQGVRGVGQTSWGPTLFALTRTTDEAHQLLGDLSSDERWHECDFQVSAPRNRGATVETR